MRTCPECYIELKAANREGVEIDFCPQCRGIWLDHGELEKLIQRASQVPYQQSYQPPPGYQQGAAPSYQSHQPPPMQHHDPYAHQSHGHHQPSHGHQPSIHDLKRLKHEYKHYKKHKHHPVAGFLEDVFDIFG